MADSCRESLERLAERLQRTRSLRSGDIVFRVAGSSPATYCLSCRHGRVDLVESQALTQDAALVEVMGDADIIRSILDGDQDARRQFFAGRFRVRGDVRYISDLSQELGLIREPI